MLILTCITFCSCEPNSQTKNQVKELENKDELELTETPIDNEYTKIVLSLCNEVYENKFTSTNAEYFDLNGHGGKDCFVFSSSLYCGAPMGTCGSNIQIIRRFGDKYKIVFEACGFNIFPSIETNFEFLAFTYETKDGIKKKVYFNGKKFVEKAIYVNNLDYDKLKIISEKTNYDIRSFKLKGTLANTYADVDVSVSKIQIGRKQTSELFTVSLAPFHYFLFCNDSLVFWTNNILSMETKIDDSKDFYDIITYDMHKYKMKRDTSYFIPIVYKYSKKSKKYEIIGK